MSEKNKKILIILYVIGFIFGFFFVRATLATDKVKVLTKGEVELKPEIQNISVNLEVSTNGISKTYAYSQTDAESTYDLLQSARKAGIFHFETTEYADRTDIKFFDINGKEYISNMFLNGEQITSKIKQTKLVNGTTYTLKLTSK